MYKGQVPDRLTLRLPKELWAVMRRLRERWGLSNEEVVRRLVAEKGEQASQTSLIRPQSPAPGAIRPSGTRRNRPSYSPRLDGSES